MLNSYSADSAKRHARISILGLDDVLALELRQALEANQCKVFIAPSARRTKSDLVFCPSDLSAYRAVARLNPNCPVVVVSRIPEVSGWLDALEAGAADYCAAPFEAIQVRWLVDTHLRSSRVVAAA